MLCVLMTFVSTSGATATRLAHFGPGAGYIVLDNVNCNGIETNLTQCGHRGFGVHNCAPSEDAGAFCSTGRSLPRPVRRRKRSGIYCLCMHLSSTQSSCEIVCK